MDERKARAIAARMYDPEDPEKSLRDALEFFVMALDEARAERDEARNSLARAEMCDACAGTGVALSGSCGCGGTGRLSDMLAHVRVVLNKTERDLANAKERLVQAEERGAEWAFDAMRERCRREAAPGGPCNATWLDMVDAIDWSDDLNPAEVCKARRGEAP